MQQATSQTAPRITLQGVCFRVAVIALTAWVTFTVIGHLAAGVAVAVVR